jgi:sterol 24-C-methyltransferase
MDPKYSFYQLHAKIDAMEKFIDLNKFIEGDKNSIKQIRSYYRINHWAYRHYHSQDGFMHFRVSPNGCFTDEDAYFQPDSVSKYIKPGDVVIDFGSGQGANVLYLAHCHPDATFYGIDLFPLKRKDIPSNVTILAKDYSNLPEFEDNSVDVMYALETLVHCSDKEKVLKEFYRVLKPNGVFVVYDYALADHISAYEAHIQKAVALISKGGAAAMIESLAEWNAHFANVGLKLEEMTDYVRQTLPDLKRLERKAAKILERPWLARLMFWLLPDQFVSNIILGYLGYDAGNAGIGTYQKWVFRKPQK